MRMERHMPANKSIVGESRILWPGREMDIEGKGVFTLPARWCQNVTTPGGLDRKIYMMLLLDRLMTTTARRPVSVEPDDGERDHGRRQGRDTALHGAEQGDLDRCTCTRRT